MEEALLDWVINQQARRINISVEMICSKVWRIQFQVNERLKEAEKSTLKFSDGWLNNFKSTWGLSISRSHGESGDADMTAVFLDFPAALHPSPLLLDELLIRTTSAEQPHGIEN